MRQIHFLEARKIAIGLKSSFRSIPALAPADQEKDGARHQQHQRHDSPDSRPRSLVRDSIGVRGVGQVLYDDRLAFLESLPGLRQDVVSAFDLRPFRVVNL